MQYKWNIFVELKNVNSYVHCGTVDIVNCAYLRRYVVMIFLNNETLFLRSYFIRFFTGFCLFNLNDRTRMVFQISTQY